MKKGVQTGRKEEKTRQENWGRHKKEPKIILRLG